MLRAGFWGGGTRATACTVLTKGRALCTALLGHILPKLTPIQEREVEFAQSFRAEKTEFHGYKTGRPEHQLWPNREAVECK